MFTLVVAALLVAAVLGTYATYLYSNVKEDPQFVLNSPDVLRAGVHPWLNVQCCDRPGKRAWPLRVELLGRDSQVLWSASGTCDAAGRASFAVSGTVDGSSDQYIWRVFKADGSLIAIRRYRLESKPSLKIVTDKPIHQPGQPVLVRFLLRSRVKGPPAKGVSLKVTLQDESGVEVFSQMLVTSRFGLASTSIPLAGDQQEGDYLLKVTSKGIAPGPDVKIPPGRTAKNRPFPANGSQRIKVRRYRLPKFKVSAHATAAHGPYAADAADADGQVTATYMFGEPVRGAVVHLAMGREPAPDKPGKNVGKTDNDGKLSFQIPADAGGVGTELWLTVVDEAGERAVGNTRVRRDKSAVAPAAAPLTAAKVAAIRLVPENIGCHVAVESQQERITVVASDERGRPLRGSLRLKRAGKTRTQVYTVALSDGVGEFEIHSDECGDLWLATWQGSASEKPLELRAHMPKMAYVWTDSTVANAGTAIRVVAAPVRNGWDSHGSPLFVDLECANGPMGTLLLPREVPNEEAAFAVPHTARGPCVLAVHRGTDDRVVQAIPLDIIRPADTPDLTVTARLAQSRYKPGSTAKLNVKVRGARGPKVAALSLVGVDTAVDELVRALGGGGDSVDAVLAANAGHEEAAPWNATPRDKASVLDVHPWLKAPRFAAILDKAALATASSPDPATEAKRELANREEEAEDLRHDYFGGYNNHNYPSSGERSRERWHRTYAAPVHARERAVREFLVRDGSKVLLAVFCALWLLLLQITFVGPSTFASIRASALRKRIVGQVLAVASWLGFLLAGAIVVHARWFRRAVDTVAGGAPLRKWLVDGLNDGDVFARPLIVFLVLCGAWICGWQGRRATRNAHRDEEVWVRRFCGLFAALSIASVAALFVHSTVWDAFELESVTMGAGLAFPLAVVALVRRFRINTRSGPTTDVAEPRTTQQPTRGQWLWPAVRMALFPTAIPIVVVGIIAHDVFGDRRYERRYSYGAVAEDHRSDIYEVAIAEKAEEPAEPDPASRVRRQKARQMARRAKQLRDELRRRSLRTNFPETLLWRPEVITDENGDASLEFPVADAITNYRIGIDAIDLAGATGRAQTELSVFAPFFVNADFPALLTRNDEVTIGAQVHNHTTKALKVAVRLSPKRWLRLLGDAERAVSVPAKSSARVNWRIAALEAGTHQVELIATAAGQEDAVMRPIRVASEGAAVHQGSSASWTAGQSFSIDIPKAALPGSISCDVQAKPTPLIDAADAVQSMLTRPHGCCEQTLSSTWPDALVLAYAGKVADSKRQPVVAAMAATARQHLASGLQRLRSYEVKGGGFSLYGKAPADPWLTAYALVVLRDIAAVTQVDQELVRRTTEWLQQNMADSRGSAATTAWYAWALAGRQGHQDVSEELRDAIANPGPDLKTNAILLTACVDLNCDASAQDRLADKVARTLKRRINRAADRKALRGRSQRRNGGFGGRFDGTSDLVPTALAAHSLFAAKRHRSVAIAALAPIRQGLMRGGYHVATQQMVHAVRALLSTPAAPAPELTIPILFDGQSVGSIRVGDKADDAARGLVFRPSATPGTHQIAVSLPPNTMLPIMTRCTYNMNADRAGLPHRFITIDSALHTPKVAKGKRVDITTTVRWRAADDSDVVMVRLALPPGAELNRAALDKWRGQHFARIDRIEPSLHHVVLYARGLSEAQPLVIPWSFVVRQPMNAAIAVASAWLFYAPDVRAQSRSLRLLVE